MTDWLKKLGVDENEWARFKAFLGQSTPVTSWKWDGVMRCPFCREIPKANVSHWCRSKQRPEEPPK